MWCNLSTFKLFLRRSSWNQTNEFWQHKKYDLKNLDISFAAIIVISDMFEIIPNHSPCVSCTSDVNIWMIAISVALWSLPPKAHIDGLVTVYSNSIANALELLQTCTKSSISYIYIQRITFPGLIGCPLNMNTPISNITLHIIDGLVHERRNSIAILELRLSCTIAWIRPPV